MKFSCGRCGKKYATAETPAPGRVYKIKCKACGHLIVVKASSAGQQTATTELRPPTTELPAASAPASGGGDGFGLNLEVAAPEPHSESTPLADVAGTPVPGALPPEPSPRAFVTDTAALTPANGTPHGSRRHDDTQEISVSSLQPIATPPPVATPESGYVDLFGGGEPAKAEAKPDAPAEPAAPAAPVEDPFVAAARASLPDGYGKTSPAPDPFAPMRDDLRTPPPEPLASASSPGAAAKVPVIARPAQEKSKAPFILIGAGALVLMGILAFVLMGGQKPPAPPAPPPRTAVAVAPAPPPVAPPPTPAPPVAEPPPVAAAAPAAAPDRTDRAPKADARAAAADERKAREERRAQEREAKAARDRDAKEARDREKAAREAKAREERDARDREKAARDAKAREDREARDRERARQEQEKVAAAGLGEPEGGLSQDQVQKVLSSTRKAFESCIVNAGKSGAVQLDGRRVMLRLNIQTNGAVTYPTLDDVTLNGTDLGSCLKSASRLMVFPKFKGDTMHVEVPLVLAGGK